MSEDGKIILDAIGEMKRELKGDIVELRQDVSILKQKVLNIEEDVAVLKEEVSGLKKDVAVLKEDVAVLKEDVAYLKADNISLKNSITRLEIKMENELERNIKLVMENHLDLSRKLDEAIEMKKQFQMGLIRIEILERDVKGIKEYVSYPA